MTRNSGFTHLMSFAAHILLLFALVFAGACGTGEYNNRLDKRIRELKANTPEPPAGSADSEADSQASDSSGPDESDEDFDDPDLDEDLSEEDDPFDPALEDEALDEESP